MKIYFDGCAKTLGLHGCSNGWDKRFSTRLCEKLGAEEYNISRSGGSNRRLCRNLFEHQEKIHEFDLFIIQMSKRKRPLHMAVRTTSNHETEKYTYTNPEFSIAGLSPLSRQPIKHVIKRRSSSNIVIM